MSRDLTTALKNELAAAGMRLVIFVSADFPSGTLRIFTGLGQITWNSETWTGMGQLLSISQIGESGSIVANALNVTLSGIPSDALNKCLTECRSGRDFKLWLGAMDDSGAVIADPYLAFSGYPDVPTVTDDGATCTISLTVESDLADLQRARPRACTHVDQQILHPGDMFFERAEYIQNWNGAWGRLNSGQKTVINVPIMGVTVHIPYTQP